jgi:biotin synthase
MIDDEKMNNSVDNVMLKHALNKAESGEELTRSDAMTLLSIEENGSEYYELLGIASRDARRRYGGHGLIFAQIGIEASPCPANCAFCSLAADVFDPNNSFVLPVSESERLTDQLVAEGVDDLFLMTTINYGRDDFIKYASSIRKRLSDNIRFVANVGDFDLEYAKRLKDAGFTGAYHIRRLGEGVDTQLPPEQRIRTLDAIQDAGLELYYCVEPIGPEHTPDEIADEIFRAKNYPVGVMAVMKRICVPGTKLYPRGEISAVTLAKICAVTELCVRPARGMGVHEPDELCLVSGANQIYAELSVNPRDRSLQTEKSRGASIERAERLLFSAGWKR